MLCSKKLHTHLKKIGRRCQLSCFDCGWKERWRKCLFAWFRSNLVILFKECQKVRGGHFWLVFRARWLFLVRRQWGIAGNVYLFGPVRTTYFHSNELMTCCHPAISCLWSMRCRIQCLFAACHTCPHSNWECLFEWIGPFVNLRLGVQASLQVTVVLGRTGVNLFVQDMWIWPHIRIWFGDN